MWDEILYPLQDLFLIWLILKLLMVKLEHPHLDPKRLLHGICLQNL